MKRKKWSELEEQTLITKYADLQNSGTLAKLRTREKKFKPIADHINSIHHFHDPINFPFKWSWRDVSIKVQNMRHQYLGVKQKIRVSDLEFNWDDGENHWDNFMIYKEVFGDFSSNVEDLGLGFETIDCDEFGDEDDDTEEESSSIRGEGRKMRRIGLLGARVLELRDVLVKREDRRKESDFSREEVLMSKEECRRRMESFMETRVVIEEKILEERQCELEELEIRVSRHEFDREMRLERELDEERRWRMKMEEKREEEEMVFRERMLGLQLDHEKQMMQMHADACQNQMQIIGFMARFMCQFFGTASDGLGGGIASLHPQVLQNLQHPGEGELGCNSKPGSDSPPEFI